MTEWHYHGAAEVIKPLPSRIKSETKKDESARSHYISSIHEETRSEERTTSTIRRESYPTVTDWPEFHQYYLSNEVLNRTNSILACYHNYMSLSFSLTFFFILYAVILSMSLLNFYLCCFEDFLF